MIQLSPETEDLARQIADLKGLSPDDVIRRAIEESARSAGVMRKRRRMTRKQMMAVGREIVAMPLLDHRSPAAIMDDVDAP